MFSALWPVLYKGSRKNNYMFGLGLPELLVILVIVMLLFGGKKLPELSKSVGEAIRELRKGFTDDTSEKKDKKTPAKKS